MNWVAALFSESSGVSMTRFLSLVCVLTASLIALYAVCKGSNLDSVSILCGTFLGAGMGAKVVQKSIEVRDAQKD